MNKLIMTLSILITINCNSANQKKIFKTNEVIWGFDFIDNNKVIYTEKSGKINLYNMISKKNITLASPKNVSIKGQGGLLDIKLHPNFKSNKRVYFTYAKKINDEYTTALSYGVYKSNKIDNIKEIFVAKALSSNDHHFGSRIAFDSDNNIYLSIGERGQRDQAQNLKSHKGKILKLTDEGRPSSDNPFLKNKSALDEIWSYGHRNPQGLFIHPTTNNLWEVEFGPRGGDELNLIHKSKNYGWPVITYGREYWGPKIGETHKKLMEQPIAYWRPSISPSGMTIYNYNRYPEWKGKFFLANLSSKHIRVLTITNKKVTEQKMLLKKYGWRFRHIRANQQGRIFFSTDHGYFGELLTNTKK